MADLLGACSPEPEFPISLAFHQTKGRACAGTMVGAGSWLGLSRCKRENSAARTRSSVQPCDPWLRGVKGEKGRRRDPQRVAARLLVCRGISVGCSCFRLADLELTPVGSLYLGIFPRLCQGKPTLNVACSARGRGLQLTRLRFWVTHSCGLWQNSLAHCDPESSRGFLLCAQARTSARGLAHCLWVFGLTVQYPC